MWGSRKRRSRFRNSICGTKIKKLSSKAGANIFAGYTVNVRDIYIDEVVERHRNGELLECFCSGTAVIVSPVKEIEYKGIEMPIKINEEYKLGELTNFVFN